MSDTFQLALKRELRSGPTWMWVFASDKPEQYATIAAAEKQAEAWKSQGFETRIVQGPVFVLP